jgi:transposase
MRGAETKQSSMLCLLSPEDRVPKDHPLRDIKKLADAALAEMSPLFDEMYSAVGRPSVPPERLIKSSLLIALYTIRSERQFCEQLDYNMLFRWFLDMSMVEPSFDPTVFTKNRARLIEHDVGKQLLGCIVQQARKAGLMSNEHFTVDGTLIEAWASLKSFRRKDEKPGDRPPPDDPGNPSVNFHGEKRRNNTHVSTTDPESKLARKSNNAAAKLSYSQHALMENRSGLLVELRIAEANGTAERAVALDMLETEVPGVGRATVGGDKGFDTKEFVADCRELGITPHVTQNITERRGSAIDGRTTRQPGYAISQRIRKRVEEIFGWLKTIGGFRRTRYRGEARTQLASYLVGAAYNLLRMAKLLGEPA